ncbi:MAG: response regulator [Bacteroidales bacterium]|nr:response regulator [Bacteroidales bacterium]MBQ8810969.1 response regulator [Bacteroidales bacterium]
MKILAKIAISAAIILYTGAATYEMEAEPLKFLYEHYSSDDGLPHNSICDIHQDSRGYLWLCTWYGLSRYDGNGFVNYTMRPGDFSNLSHNRILSVDEDRSGYLWIITYDYHLYRFDVDTEEFVPIPSGLENFPDTNIKVDIVHCAEDGNVWVSFAGAGLLRVSPDLSHTSWFNTGDHFIGKDISAIYEDSEGTVYVASETGITQIRGGAVSLLARNAEVKAFAEHDGVVYFTMPDQLLAVDMDSREQKHSDFHPIETSLATSMMISGGRIFIGFSDNALAVVDPETLSMSVRRTDMGRVRYLFPDPEGLLWIATERTGIWYYNASEDVFRHFEHENNVMSYYVDTLANVMTRGGRTWIKMNNWGFGYYDRCCDEVVPLDNVRHLAGHRFMNGVACYDIDSSGVLWMSTVERGLEKVTVITPKMDVIVPPTLSEDRKSSSEVRAMLRDSKGKVWVATKSRELYRYSADMTSCERFPDERSGDIGVIYSIFEDSDGNIWLGTKGDGLVRMKPMEGSWSWKRFRHDPSDRNSLSSDNIYSITQDKDGRIWIGTYGGALSMLPDSDSDRFVTVRNSFPDYPLETGDRVRYLHCMPDGRMLVATVGGLILFEPSVNPELTVFNLIRKIPGDIKSLGNNDVIHIFTDRNGDTWLCTFGGGLNRLYFENGMPRFDVISTDEGLSSNIVNSATDGPDGKIWMATESGLSSYDPKTRLVRNYTQYDGLNQTSFSEATCTSLADGTIMFGTYDNIFHMDPDNFMSSPKASRLVVSGLSVDGERTPFSGRIVIPHDYSFFMIHFASLNYSADSQTSFSYMLEGYDKKWISGAAGNLATYSRIPPGNYVFKVAETYPDDDEIVETVSVRVRVMPSVWNSALAKILYVFLAIALLAFLARILITSMKLRNDVRLEQGLNEIKARFFTNVSHELRTPLTLILGGIEEIGRKVSDDYSVNVVRKNAKRMLNLVNQLLDTRSISDGKMRLTVSRFDVVKLVQEVYDDFRDIAVERKMELRIIKSVESLMVWGDSMRMEALVYNLLSNAFKYTSDGGRIEVGVLYREGTSEFRIMVKDNGIGISESTQKKIFKLYSKGSASAFGGMSSSGIGLSFCKEITDMHGGKIWVESAEGSGSKFFVRMPVDRERFSGDSVQFVGDEPEIRSDDMHGISKFKVEATYPEGALKVLVVEDNAELKILIYNSLSSKYEVRDASNGKDALQVMEAGWMPDIIVTDLMMPVMDGIGLINHVRNDFNTSHIPIVMITAKHEDDTHVKAMKYGADGYIAKPFTMELLMARIDNMLERRKALVSQLSDMQILENNNTRKQKKVDISPEEIVITDKDEQLIKKVMTWLEENVSDAEITVDQLAAYVGMGRTSMYNKIKGLTGKSPVELIQDFRMEKATYYLKSGQFSVSETSYKVGFSDPGYFSRSFKKHFGVSPADYIKQNKSHT